MWRKEYNIILNVYLYFHFMSLCNFRQHKKTSQDWHACTLLKHHCYIKEIEIHVFFLHIHQQYYFVFIINGFDHITIYVRYSIFRFFIFFSIICQTILLLFIIEIGSDCWLHTQMTEFLINILMRQIQVDLRHMDEQSGSNIVDVGVDLSEFYVSVEWDILDVPAVR